MASAHTPDWLRKESAHWMNLFPEVVWDRFLYESYSLSVFGWIAREDGRSDFMVLDFDYGHDGLEPATISYLTSSAKFSDEFGRRLGLDDHVSCVRVEYGFGELVPNKVELGG